MSLNGVTEKVITPEPETLGTPPTGKYWDGFSATGYWIKDDAGVILRPDVGSGIEWTEDFTTLLASGAGAIGAWTVLSLGGFYRDALIEVLISTNANNSTVGVRTVGSTLIRSEVVDNDSTVTMSVRADANGDIEYFQSATAARFMSAAKWQN